MLSVQKSSLPRVGTIKTKISSETLRCLKNAPNIKTILDYFFKQSGNNLGQTENLIKETFHNLNQQQQNQIRFTQLMIINQLRSKYSKEKSIAQNPNPARPPTTVAVVENRPPITLLPVLNTRKTVYLPRQITPNTIKTTLEQITPDSEIDPAFATRFEQMITGGELREPPFQLFLDKTSPPYREILSDYYHNLSRSEKELVGWYTENNYRLLNLLATGDEAALKSELSVINPDIIDENDEVKPVEYARIKEQLFIISLALQATLQKITPLVGGSHTIYRGMCMDFTKRNQLFRLFGVDLEELPKSIGQTHQIPNQRKQVYTEPRFGSWTRLESISQKFLANNLGVSSAFNPDDPDAFFDIIFEKVAQNPKYIAGLSQSTQMSSEFFEPESHPAEKPLYSEADYAKKEGTEEEVLESMGTKEVAVSVSLEKKEGGRPFYRVKLQEVES